MPTTALCLGGASSLSQDLEKFFRLGISHEIVVVCNDAGYEWQGDVDAWATLHPEKLNKWISKRKTNGYPDAKSYYCHNRGGRNTPETQVVSYKFQGQAGSGSSGLFTAKVALMHLGADRVVFCGVPMTNTPHFFDHIDWKSYNNFRKNWLTVPETYRNRMRSMSGWTRVLLGGPHDW